MLPYWIPHNILKKLNRFVPILDIEAQKDEVNSTIGHAAYLVVIPQFYPRSCIVFPITPWHTVGLW